MDKDNIIYLDDNELSFSKSKRSNKQLSDKIKNDMHDFMHVCLGDSLYNDPTFGYNLFSGKLIGECCVVAGELDEYPRFWAKADEQPMPMTFEHDNNIISKIDEVDVNEDVDGIGRTNELNKLGFNTTLITDTYGSDYYVPTICELLIAKSHNSILKYKLINDYYWSSSITYGDGKDYDKPFMYFLHGTSDEVDSCLALDENLVRPFINVFGNKLVNESTSLISIDNNDDITFSKSDLSTAPQYNLKQDIQEVLLHELQLATLLDFLYFNIKTGKYTISKKQPKPEYKYTIVGSCCCTAEQMVDNLPRFKYIRYSEFYNFVNDKLGKVPIITELLKYDDTNYHNDIYGYENTLILKKYEVNLTTKPNGISPDFYIPAIGELVIAGDNGKFGRPDVWSSTMFSDNMAFYYSNTWGKQHCSTTNALQIMMFIRVDQHNFEMLPNNALVENHANLLKFADRDDIHFSKSSNDGVKKLTALLVAQIRLNECKLGDFVYAVGNNKYKISHKKIDGQNEIGICVLDGSEEEPPLFMSNIRTDEMKLFNKSINGRGTNYEHQSVSKDGYMLTQDMLAESLAVAVKYVVNDLSKRYKADFYIPSYDNLKIAYNNLWHQLSDELIETNNYDWYLNSIKSNKGPRKLWTSTNYNALYAISFKIESMPLGTLDYYYARNKIVPFIHITPVDLIIDKINESTNLIQFDDDDIRFTKSDTSIEKMGQKSLLELYGFDQCFIGDIIYDSSIFGYNRIEGEPIAQCCIQVGDLDKRPRFCALEDLPSSYCWYGSSKSNSIKPQQIPELVDIDGQPDMNGNINKSGEFFSIYDWDKFGAWKRETRGNANTKKLLNHKLAEIAHACKAVNKDFYVPAAMELYQALLNIDFRKEKEPYTQYWSSSQYNKNMALCIGFDDDGNLEPEKGPLIEHKAILNSVRPFLFIPIGYTGKQI